MPGVSSVIGLAVPHVARMILGTANHKSLLPFTILSGGAVALLCNLIGVLPGEAGIIPVSYTHLDVYKRQVLYRPLEALTLSLAQDGVINKLRNSLPECPFPTRYTCLLYTSDAFHLDLPV